MLKGSLGVSGLGRIRGPLCKGSKSSNNGFRDGYDEVSTADGICQYRILSIVGSITSTRGDMRVRRGKDRAFRPM